MQARWRTAGGLAAPSSASLAATRGQQLRERGAGHEGVEAGLVRVRGALRARVPRETRRVLPPAASRACALRALCSQAELGTQVHGQTSACTL